MYRFNVKRIIRHLGGATHIARVHASIAGQFGFKKLKVNTIRSWVTGNQIRFKRLPELYAVAHHCGIGLDLEQFLETTHVDIV